MSLLDCCLAIVEPGYEAPRARAAYEDLQPPITTARDLCNTCEANDKDPGRSQCRRCINASTRGMMSRRRENERGKARHRRNASAIAEARHAAMTLSERRACECGGATCGKGER